MWEAITSISSSLFTGRSGQENNQKDYTQTLTFSVISVLLVVVILVISTVILRKK